MEDMDAFDIKKLQKFKKELAEMQKRVTDSLNEANRDRIRAVEVVKKLDREREEEARRIKEADEKRKAEFKNAVDLFYGAIKKLQGRIGFNLPPNFGDMADLYRTQNMLAALRHSDAIDHPTVDVEIIRFENKLIDINNRYKREL